MHRRTFLAAGLGVGLLAACDRNARASAPAYVPGAVGLFSTKEDVAARVDPARLAAYLEAVNAAAGRALAGTRRWRGVSGAVAIALKPPARSRVWIVLGDFRREDELTKLLKGVVEAVPVPSVSDFVAVWQDFDAWGGGKPYDKSVIAEPIPMTWRHATPAGGRFPDDALRYLWPD